MKYTRTLMTTVSILGPMAVALSSCASEPAYADRWCGSSYHDPSCVHICDYAYPNPCDTYSPGDLFFRDARRFHHRFDHRFPHGPLHGYPWRGPGSNHGGFGHSHGGGGHGSR